MSAATALTHKLGIHLPRELRQQARQKEPSDLAKRGPWKFVEINQAPSMACLCCGASLTYTVIVQSESGQQMGLGADCAIRLAREQRSGTLESDVKLARRGMEQRRQRR